MSLWYFKDRLAKQKKHGATALPTSFLGVPVVTGMLHDLRFLDKQQKNGKGVIVGLKPLGKARGDSSGFVAATTFNRFWLRFSECKDYDKHRRISMMERKKEQKAA